MARGRHLSLEEARNAGKLDQFAKENPLRGDLPKFDKLLDAMANGEPPTSATKTTAAERRTSSPARDGD